MAHGKETPRQKMIGMMYLVLTALLALNVSKDILDAFILVDSGLNETNINFAKKNSIIYDEFAKAEISNPGKVKAWKDSALVVKKMADGLVNHIQGLKIELIKYVDGNDAPSIKGTTIDGKLINGKDNLDKTAELLVGTTNNKKGKELKEMIIHFRERLIKMANGKPGIIEDLEKTLETKDPPSTEGEKHSWESHHFEHLPLVAVTTILSKMQGDIRNAESEMIKYLFEQIEAGSFKFNKLEATIIPNSNYIIRGNEYKAEVFMAAFDTTQQPKIYIGQTQEVKNPNGTIDLRMVGNYDSTSIKIDPITRKGIYSRIGTTLGTNKWSGLIKLRSTDGTWVKRKFTTEYVVAEPNVVISPTRMNVFYIGVDNPVEISVPGIQHDKITASTTNGLLRKEGNGWVAKPAVVGNAIVTVTAQIDGKPKQMGYMEFRVKNIPDPVAKVAGMKSGKIDKKTLLEQSVVVADLENFDFNAKFSITEYTITVKKGNFDRISTFKRGVITDEAKQLMSSAEKGAKVTFSEIMAVGPDGKPRELNGIILTIK